MSQAINASWHSHAELPDRLEAVLVAAKSEDGIPYMLSGYYEVSKGELINVETGKPPRHASFCWVYERDLLRPLLQGDASHG